MGVFAGEILWSESRAGNFLGWALAQRAKGRSGTGIGIVERHRGDGHLNPPDLAGMGFNFRPPFISRTRPGVLRIHLNRLSLVPDQPVAFSNRMQEVDGRADVMFADLRYEFPARTIH